MHLVVRIMLLVTQTKMRDNLMLQAFFVDEFANGDRAHDASECYTMITTL